MMKIDAEGVVCGVFVGYDKASLATTLVEEALVTFAGFEGDRHVGITRLADSRTPQYPRGTEIRNSRQVSLVSEEELGEIAAAMGVPEVAGAWLGANLCVRGILSLSFLPPSTRLVFPGGAVLVVEGANLPCRGPGEVIQSHYAERGRLTSRFPKAAMHRRGLVAWVERPGIIRVGDVMGVSLPQIHAWP
jgi:hypothetical protein